MKKHFLRIFTVLLMVCLGVGVLAACGDSNEPEPETPPQTYTVEFSLGESHAAEGVSAPAKQTGKKVGDTVTLTTLQAAADWKFDGWYSKSGKVSGTAYTVAAADAVEGTITLTAHWAEDTPATQVTVTYNMGSCNDTAYAGTTQTPASVTVDAGATVTLPQTPVWEGYNFLGWKVGNDTNLKTAGAQITVSASVTVTAQWSANSATTSPMEGVWKGVAKTQQENGATVTSTTEATIDVIDDTHAHLVLMQKMTASAPVSQERIGYLYYALTKQASGSYTGTTMFQTLGSQGGLELATQSVTVKLNEQNQLTIEIVNGTETGHPTTEEFITKENLPAALNITGTYHGQYGSDQKFNIDFTEKTAEGLGAFDVTFIDVANFVVLKAVPQEEEDGTETEAATNEGAEVDAFYGIVYKSGNDYYLNNLYSVISNIKLEEGEIDLGGEEPTTQVTVTYSMGECEGTPYAGTTQTPASVTVDAGGTVTLPDTPVWEGHTFTGWKVGGDTVTKNAKDQITVTEDVTVTAQWSLNSQPAVTYHVTYSLGDHAEADQQVPTQDDVTSSTVIHLPANDPTAAKGYRFTGWKVNDETTLKQANAEVTITGTTTITAQYEPIEYTVTFDVTTTHGNVSGNHAEVTITIEDLEVEFPTGLTLTGYTLSGWKLGNAGETHTGTYTVKETELPENSAEPEITFVAQWTAKDYTLTFNVNKPGDAPADKDITGDATTEKSVTLDDPTVTLPTIALEGYLFKGWKLNGEGNATTSFTLTVEGIEALQDSTSFSFTAEWEKKEADKFSVTFEDGEVEGTVTGKPNTVQVEAGSYTIPDEEPTCEGYTFTGWKVTADSDNKVYKKDGEGTEQSYNVSQDVTFTAQWTKNKYTVTYNYGEGTTQTKAEEQVEWGTEVTLETLTPKAGYASYTWEVSGAELQEGNKFTMPKAGVTVTAQWTKSQYTVTYEYGEGTAETKAAEQVEFGATVNLTQPEAKPGYEFAGWEVNGADYESGDSFTMPAGAVTVKATWNKIKYTVEFALGDHGTGSTPDQQTEKTVGDSIDLTTPVGEEGWVFDGWYTKDDHKVDDEQYAINPSDADDKNTITLTAHWVEEYTVEFYDGEEGEGTLLKSLTYAKNSQIGNDKENTGYADLTATKNGHEITGWYYLNEEEHVTVEAGFTPSDHADAQHKVKLYATWKHNYVNGVCSHCEDVCGHENMQDGTCPDCGVKFTAYSDEKAYTDNFGKWNGALTDYTITEGEHIILNATYATNSDEIYQGIIVRVAQAGTEMYFIRPAGDFASMPLTWNTNYGSTVMNAPGMTSTGNTEYINLKKTGKTQIEVVFENNTLTVTYRLYNADGSLKAEAPYTMTWTISNMVEESYTIGFGTDGCTLTAEGAKIAYYKWYWETEHVCDYKGHDHRCTVCGAEDPQKESHHDYTAYGHLCKFCGKVDPDIDSKHVYDPKSGKCNLCDKMNPEHVHNFDDGDCTCGAKKITVEDGGKNYEGVAEVIEGYKNNDTDWGWWNGSTDDIKLAAGDFVVVIEWDNINDKGFAKDAVFEMNEDKESPQYLDVDLLEIASCGVRGQLIKEWQDGDPAGDYTGDFLAGKNATQSVEGSNTLGTDPWGGHYVCTVTRIGTTIKVVTVFQSTDKSVTITNTITMTGMLTDAVVCRIAGNPAPLSNFKAWSGTMAAKD